MTRFLAVAILALVGACATISQMTGQSLEAQIVTGANTVRAATAVARVLSSNSKITVAQATSYNTMLHASANHLNAAGRELADCRTRTAAYTCMITVADDIRLGVAIANDVKRVLDAK